MPRVELLTHEFHDLPAMLAGQQFTRLCAAIVSAVPDGLL
jgi:hypothetical protein